MRSITRDEAIAALRSRFERLAGHEHSMCWLATRLHIFCGGFARLSSGELRERFDWIVKNCPQVSRAQLERLADSWQLARQSMSGAHLACDLETAEPHVCRGWSGFADEELARHVRELVGEEVEIVAAAPSDAP